MTKPCPRLSGSVLTRICGIYFFSRLLFIGVALVSRTMVVQGPYAEATRSWIETFQRWDSNWYLEIARAGYRYDPHSTSSVAFYPLYPLLIRGLHVCGLDPLIAGYTISHAALFGACLLLWRLTAWETRSAKVADLAVTFLLLGPGAVWFGLIYTESLFLLTLLGAMFAARRGRWLAAAAWGYAAALTRTPGLFLAIFFGLEAIQQWWETRRSIPPSLAADEAGRGRWPLSTPVRMALAVAGPVLGQLTFLIFLQLAFGDWRAQQKTMSAGWYAAGFRWPWTALAANWRASESVYPLLGDPLLAVTLAAGIASFWTLRRWAYPAFVLALALLYVVTTNGDSLVRYCATIVPVYLVLAQAARRSRMFEAMVISGSVAVFVLLTVLFANGYQII